MQSFAVVRRRQLQGYAFALLLLAFFVSAPLWGPAVSLSTLAAIVVFLVLALVADWFFLYANWACPRCGKFLGAFQWRRIQHCAHCGYALH
jgi:ribosomal protein S27AE